MNRITSQLRSLDFHEDPTSHVVTLTTKTNLSLTALGWSWLATTVYQILQDGSTMACFVYLDKPDGTAPQHIPRLGLDLLLSKELQHVKWFGLGPGESYPDKQASQRVGIWEVGDIAQLHTLYNVPQENSNRMHIR